MEAYMERAQHKTTILLTRTLHERLSSLARQRGVSMGWLIRSAVEAQYGSVDREERLSAVHALGALSLPVDTVEVMKAESDPYSLEALP
jgi:predicted DNA-binding protein